jgi:hypothetical protein
MRAGRQDGAGQEEHVLRGAYGTPGDESLAQPEHAAAQQGPPQGEVAGLPFAQDGVALRYLQERLEPGEQRGPVREGGSARRFGGSPLGRDLAPTCSSVLGLGPLRVDSSPIHRQVVGSP